VSRTLMLHRAAVRRQLPGIDVSVLEVPEDGSGAILESLRNSGLFEFVERDYYARTAAVPNDPSYPSQWYLPVIQLPQAWDVTTGSSSVVAAVIDSGVDSSHPDLASKLVPGWNFLSNSADTRDVLGHGTAVAGVLAAASNNGTGVAGVTWGGMVMPLAVVDASDFASYSNIAAAIQYAADHGARIINISIGGANSSAALQSAVDYAWSKGAVIFASAMNASANTPYYPAACNHVLAIGATDSSDSLASFSNYGNWIALAAPGANILAPVMGGGYGYWYGTSFASPIAAGVAALALSANPALTNSALVSVLEQNADDLGAAGFDPSFGWGRVNAYKTALAARQGPIAVTVTPAAVTLGPSQAAQFTAAVTGSSATVAWSLSPAVGTISATGRYTAPAVLSSSQTVTVTAAVPGAGATAKITLAAPPPIPPAPPAPARPIRINAGGPAYVDFQGQTWSADTGFSGGAAVSTGRPIANTQTAPLYKAARTGQFSYQVAVPSGAYTVNLKFAEIVQNRVGQRAFNVAINGAPALANFDIVAAAGGAFTAVDKTFPVNVTNGLLAVAFSNGKAGAPLVSAIEILAGTAAPSFAVMRVNSGGPDYTDGSGLVWRADSGFSGGNLWSTSAAISNTTAPALYQTQRWGEFQYQFAVPNGSYLVTLKFSETSQLGIGQRRFNVAINGAPALTNFDIFAQAGGGFIPLDKTFPVSVSNGQIAIVFTAGSVNWPEVNGIQIAAGGGTPGPGGTPLRTQGGVRTAPAERTR
jgi:hypothetical protein